MRNSPTGERANDKGRGNRNPPRAARTGRNWLPLFERPLQCALGLGRGLITLAGIFIEKRANHPVERGRHGQRRGLLVQNGRDHSSGVWPFEGPAAGQHFIQHAPERKQVATGVGFFALQLLRRHILQRADDFALAGDGLRESGIGFFQRTTMLGEPEIQQLDAGARYQDIGGLQVAMREALFVRRIQRV